MPGPSSFALSVLLSFAVPAAASSSAQPPTTDEPDAAARVSIPQPAPGDPLAVRQLVLPNGLTVLLSENHERPEVFGAIVVRTGGKNDPPDQTGMSHYLEHMLFKGTTDFGTLDWEKERPLQERLEQLYDDLAAAPDDDARKAVQDEIAKTVQQTYAYAVPNELDQLLEELGGTGVNAFTTYDETVYHNTFPASQIETWLSIYAHRFEDPVFRLFPTELEAVYEEKNIAIDTTGYEMFRRFMKGAFPDHPYGSNDILGEIEHLKRPPLRAMKAYFERYYVPGNMALVLSGDFDSAAILPVIEAGFGRWKAGPDPAPPQYPVEPFDGNERLRMRATPVRVGAVAYRTVPESHPDYAALQVARRLLSNEQRSGYIDRLSDEGKVLFAVHVPADLADHNLDVVAYVPRVVTQTFRGAERRMVRELHRVRDGDFDDATFEAHKEGLWTEQKALWEDNEERALTMAHAFVAQERGWEGYLDYLDHLRTLTRTDVERVAQELFGDQRLVMRSRMGFPRKTRLDKPEYPPVEPPRGKHSSYFEQVRAQPKPAPRLQLVDPRADVPSQQLRPGVTLTTGANPFNDLYQLELRFGVGQDSMRELDVLAAYLPRIGTSARTGQELREQLSALSTTLEVEAELSRFVVRLSGPQAHLPEALGLLAELMASPRAEGKPLRQVRREIWAFRRYDRQDAVNVGRALRDHVLYGEDSPQHREHGYWGARMLTAGGLLDTWQQIQQRGVEVSYVGQASAREVSTLVRERLPLPEQPRPLKPRVVYARSSPDETTVYFVPRRDAVQTQLWFAVEGDPVAKVEVPAALAFGEYFGGSMAGLVFQEVREFRALAYAAKGAYPLDGNVYQRGQLIGYVGCQADKTFEALDVMVGLITEMPQRPERLPMVKGALVRSLETASPSFRDLPQAVADWRAQGYGEDPRRWLLPAFEALEFEDIAQFYREHVEGRPVAIMVVGDPRKVKVEQLRKYGTLRRVREGALYSR
ncbi:M16 family metallopeptidase [Paraliomyxa miuraensis]|uniref:M16 family metallopeptidase n=1 Tax=Paraliomyxa miuraensis TaxID=376150 RepID=UPI00224E80FF|nr:M16 family metallopeptidase [Paraliomyxa miuraensis]MCX4245838.1 insulinase family protein [Paraliomyxa miuraensis]